MSVSGLTNEVPGFRWVVDQQLPSLSCRLIFPSASQDTILQQTWQLCLWSPELTLEAIAGKFASKIDMLRREYQGWPWLGKITRCFFASFKEDCAETLSWITINQRLTDFVDSDYDALAAVNKSGRWRRWGGPASIADGQLILSPPHWNFPS